MAISLLGLGLVAGTAAAQGYPAPPPVSPYPTVQSTAPASVLPPPATTPNKAVQFQRDALVSAPVPAQHPVTVDLPVPAQAGGGKGPAPKTGYDALEFRSLKEVPGPEVLTRLESEAAWRERLRQESLKQNERIVFPDEPVLAKEPYAGRKMPPYVKAVEPSYLCHGRLLFEQQNFERGTWDFGVFTAPVELAKFYWDVALLPYHCFSRPCQCMDTSAGKCLPGDPTPFYLYPPELSLTGLAAEAAAVTGVFFIFP
jgi:hypothetical protein